MNKTFFKIDTPRAAELVNRLKEEKIRLFSVKKAPKSLLLSVKSAKESAVIALLDKLCYNYRVVKRSGFGRSAASLLTRWGLSAGAALAIIAFIASSFFVTDVRVTGFSGTAEVERILKENGFAAFTPKSKIDCGALERLLAGSFPNMAFAACRIDGSVLKIDVLENKPDETPQEKIKPLSSLYDAIITRVLVGSGTAVVNEGDTVRVGDTLIDCYYKTGEGESEKLFEVPSEGAVYGRVWLKREVALTDSDLIRVRTGNKSVVKRVVVAGIGGGGGQSPFAAYESETRTQTIFGILPIKVATTVYYETKVVDGGRSYAERLDEEIAKARAEFMAEAGKGAVINKIWTIEKKCEGFTAVEIYCESETRIDNGGAIDKKE